MPVKKREHPKEKTRLHSRNKHRERYDFSKLTLSCPELAPFVRLNMFEDESIDFADPAAVKMLNRALLIHFYGIANWDIPDGFLCPPIPGRADYLHHVADLLGSKNFGVIPRGGKIKCFDIGVGANCIYPILGNIEYGWSFIGSDIDPLAIESASKIVGLNPVLADKIEFRIQKQPNDIFFGILQKEEVIDLSVCNPPFHASAEEAKSGALLKQNNLSPGKSGEPVLNFGGQHGELWCKGGEGKFVQDMVRQSKFFAKSCFWFTTLISKQSHLKGVYDALSKEQAMEVKTIPMGQGNKSSRMVAWTFLTREEQSEWRNTRWMESSVNKEHID
ncbi:MAG: 23S rRNA (adenine(1618)-N(6))-methyltransferase RlmF [Bacteroidales bacterium]